MVEGGGAAGGAGEGEEGCNREEELVVERIPREEMQGVTG
jgi:hypothetical protein